eukprot:GHVR01047056.1.p1 GENE.GHVR01047056.1~~GHVR01047056.1.p1  ORF type:complete len:511 (-),score=104.06 GHVR01047056.1:696-2228(-)
MNEQLEEQQKQLKKQSEELAKLIEKTQNSTSVEDIENDIKQLKEKEAETEDEAAKKKITEQIAELEEKLKNKINELKKIQEEQNRKDQVEKALQEEVQRKKEAEQDVVTNAITNNSNENKQAMAAAESLAKNNISELKKVLDEMTEWNIEIVEKIKTFNLHKIFYEFILQSTYQREIKDRIKGDRIQEDNIYNLEVIEAYCLTGLFYINETPDRTSITKSENHITKCGIPHVHKELKGDIEDRKNLLKNDTTLRIIKDNDKNAVFALAIPELEEAERAQGKKKTEVEKKNILDKYIYKSWLPPFEKDTQSSTAEGTDFKSVYLKCTAITMEIKSVEQTYRTCLIGLNPGDFGDDSGPKIMVNINAKFDGKNKVTEGIYKFDVCVNWSPHPFCEYVEFTQNKHYLLQNKYKSTQTTFKQQYENYFDDSTKDFPKVEHPFILNLYYLPDRITNYLIEDDDLYKYSFPNNVNIENHDEYCHGNLNHDKKFPTQLDLATYLSNQHNTKWTPKIE